MKHAENAPQVRAIVFDAVGTLIYARPSVAEVYCDVAQSFHWHGTVSEIRRRFAKSLAHFAPENDFRTSEAHELARWRAVVGSVFHDLSTEAADAIFAKLWSHFAASAAWSVYPDALRAINNCRAAGWSWYIGSNFDTRLKAVIAGHAQLAGCSGVFCCSEVGYCKPAVEFYRYIENALQLPPETLLMVGDDERADARAAQQAGWNSIWLNRDDHQPGLDHLLARFMGQG